MSRNPGQNGSVRLKVQKNGRRAFNKKPVITNKLPCHCGRPIDHSWTVRCAVCTRWFHAECIGLPDKYEKLIDELACTDCTKSYNVTSKFRPKCRLAGCNEPAVAGQYCSVDHRQEFWRQAVKHLQKNDDDVRILKWLAQKYPSSKYEQLVNFDSDTLHYNGNLSEKSVEETQSQREQLELALERRVEQGICGFDPKLINQEGEICQEKTNCRQHKKWTEILPKRIQLSTETIRERRAPDPVHVAKQAKSLVMGSVRFSDTTRSSAYYIIPYLWTDNDKDFFLNGDPQPYWDREF